MGSLYGGTTVSGYNANPPPDDGTTVSTNQITWNSTIKSKIGDPLNTFATNVDANITTAFGKTLDGGSTVSTAVDYPAGAADQGRMISVTVSGKTVTTPDAGTVNTPFVFAVKNSSTGTINLAPNATNSQTIDGGTASLVIQSGGSTLVKTDGTNWFTLGFKPGNNTLSGSNYGFVPAVNASLSCSVGSNLLTVALKTKAGNDPSASDPLQIAFRDTTLTNGDPVWVTVSSALSINTNATGATLASQNGKPFRFWIVAFNNAGTVVLALWHSGAGASSIAINPLNEATLQSTTGISAGATSAGVFYTPNGTTLSSKAFRILGYLEYVSGLTTAGTYAAAPDIVQLFGPGITRPGHVVQTVYATATSSTISNSATKVATNTTGSITPTSSNNLILTRAIGSVINSNLGILAVQISRGSSPTLVGSGVVASAIDGTGGSGGCVPVTLEVIDNPATTSSTSYTVYIWTPNGSAGGTWIGTQNSFATQSTIILQELMG